MKPRTIFLLALAGILLNVLYFVFILGPAMDNVIRSPNFDPVPPSYSIIQGLLIFATAILFLIFLVLKIKRRIRQKGKVQKPVKEIQIEPYRPRSKVEKRVSYYYNWAELGSGKLLFNKPVMPEPPFVVFDPEGKTISGRYTDCVLPHWKFKDKYWKDSIYEPAKCISTNRLIPEVLPNPSIDFTNQVEIQIITPRNEPVNIVALERCLLLINPDLPVSFEIVATPEKIVFQFVMQDNEEEAMRLVEQLKATFPSARISFTNEYLADCLEKPGGKNSYYVAYSSGALKQEFIRPIKIYENRDPDPYISLIASLEDLPANTIAVVRVSFQKIRSGWKSNLLPAVTLKNGDPFFSNAPEMVKLAKEKSKEELFATTVTIYSVAEGSEAITIVDKIARSVGLSTKSEYNKVFFSYNEKIISLGATALLRDIMYRCTRNTGMILTSKELMTLVRLPSPAVVSNKIRVEGERKTKFAPKNVVDNDYLLGINTHEGYDMPVGLNLAQRLRHVHIIGASGTGKSQLLLKLIKQDIDDGRGFIVLDPHGDLIENTLTHITEARYQDVIVIDPSDSEYPVGLNLLTAYTELEKTLLSSDLVGIFKRTSTTWGDQMNSILANAIHAFLESDQGGTLIDLRRFLSDESFRSHYLQSVNDVSTRYYWEHEFPQLRQNAVAPILTRLDSFLRPKIIRNMMAQKDGIDFVKAVNSRKIILAKLARGLIGQENSRLLGNLLVAKINQVAQSRQQLNEHERTPFFLYIDEFQNFITPSMEEILSGARKYGVGMILAHQGLKQMFTEDRNVAEGVISNTNTRICFRLGDKDAEELGRNFKNFSALDLQSQAVGQAIIRVGGSDNDCNIQTQMLPKVDEVEARRITEKVIGYSRSNYAKEKEEVERLWEEMLGKNKTVIEKTKPKEKTKAKTDDLTSHRKIQKLVQSLGEKHGFKAVIEESTASGQTDVGLTSRILRIACEVSVTNTPEYEVKAIRKRLQEGYDLVIVTSNNDKHVSKIKEKANETLEDNDRSLVYFCNLLDLDDYLGLLPKDLGEKEVIKGYTVESEFPDNEDHIVPPSLLEDN